MEPSGKDLSYSLSMSGISDAYLGVLNQHAGIQSLRVDADSISNILSFSDSDCGCDKNSSQTFTINDLTSSNFWDKRFGDTAIAHFTGYDQSGRMFSQALSLTKPTKTEGNDILFNFSHIDGNHSKISNDLDHADLNHAVLAFAPKPNQTPDSITGQATNQENSNNYSFLNASISNLTVSYRPNSVGAYNIGISIPKNSITDLTGLQSANNSLGTTALSMSDLVNQDTWGELFNSINPAVALNWIDSTGNSRTISLKINKPSFNPTLNEYWISASPINKDDLLGEHLNINNATLVFDSTESSNNSQTSKDPKPVLPPIAVDILEGAGGIVGAYGLYAACRAMIQQCLTSWGTKENIYDTLLPVYEEFFPTREGALNFANRFSERFQKLARYIDDIPADAEGFGKLNGLIDGDSFVKDCLEYTTDILGDFRDEFSPSNFANLRERLLSNLQDSSRTASWEMADIYEEGGYEAIINFYTEKVGVSAEELMQNPDLFTDFAKIAKAVRRDLDTARLSTQQTLRTAMQESGFPCGIQLDSCWDGDIATEFTEGPAEDLAGQMIAAGELDAADTAAAFVLEDIIGIIIEL
jgi:hypothetical protein